MAANLPYRETEEQRYTFTILKKRMKKRTILLLALLLTSTLCLTTANAEQEWVHQKTLNFGGVVRSLAFGDSGTNQLAIGIDYNHSTYNLEIYEMTNFNNVNQNDVGNRGISDLAFRNGWYEVAVSHSINRTRLAFYNSKRDFVIEDEGSLGGSITALAYRPDGKRLAITTDSPKNKIIIWYTDHQNGNRKQLRSMGNEAYWSVAWSPNGNILASGGPDGTVRLWNPNTGVNYAVLRGHQGAVRDLAFSPNGQRLASVSRETPYVILWNVNTESKVRTISTGKATSVAWSPDGNTLAVGTYYSNGSIRLHNPNNGGLKRQLNMNGTVLSVDFNPSGRLLAGGGGSKFVRIFKLITVNPSDVTKDGRVDINDLIEVARNYGKTGTNNADVNNDKRVDVKDFIAVAKAVNPAFAAPILDNQLTTLPFTAEQVQQWIQDAKKQGVDAEGIATLEQLLQTILQQAAPPQETALLANYPNPFNPETWIPYQLATPAEVRVSIYTADGTLVRTLTLGQLPAGVYQDKDRAAYWDGTNEQGESVASGVYFYTLKAGDFAATKKMLIRK